MVGGAAADTVGCFFVSVVTKVSLECPRTGAIGTCILGHIGPGNVVCRALERAKRGVNW